MCKNFILNNLEREVRNLHKPYLKMELSKCWYLLPMFLKLISGSESSETLIRLLVPPPGTPESEIAQSCLTLWDPTDCSLPGSSIHGIFQARVLEWVTIPFSRGSSWPRDHTQISRTVGEPLPSEPPGKSWVTVSRADLRNSVNHGYVEKIIFRLQKGILSSSSLIAVQIRILFKFYLLSYKI